MRSQSGGGPAMSASSGSALSVRSAIGRAADDKGRALIAAFVARYDCGAIATPLDEPARVDGALYDIETGVMFALYEARCRSYTRAQCTGDTYLLDMGKIDKLTALARDFCMPTLLIVQMAEGDRYWWKIANKHGRLVSVTETRKTTNASMIDTRRVTSTMAMIPFGEARQW